VASHPPPLPAPPRLQAKQAAQLAERAAAAAAKGDAAGPALEDDASEETDPTKYYENRVRALSAAKARGENPYPHKFHVSMQLPAYVAAFAGLEAGAQEPATRVSLAGRVSRKAGAGAKLIFFDLVSEGAKVQVMCDARNFGGAEGAPLAAFVALMNSVKRGDIVGLEGHPGKSKRGELSVFPASLTVLAPCLHMPPGDRYPLANQETRYRQRYLDLISNPRVADVFRTRARVITAIRAFLDQRGFLEASRRGGRAGRPRASHPRCLRCAAAPPAVQHP
jgi:lysyl-tRNA synthetase class 2